MPDSFRLTSRFKPEGDQPDAIEALVRGDAAKKRHQVLLGVTGSGKTFTMAQTIARVNRPTLVMVHNKTLAAEIVQGITAGGGTASAATLEGVAHLAPFEAPGHVAEQMRSLINWTESAGAAK